MEKIKRFKALLVSFLVLALMLLPNMVIPARAEENDTQTVSANQIVMVEKQKMDIDSYFGASVLLPHKYVVSDVSKATVSKTGVLKAVKKGEFTVSLKIKNNGAWQDSGVLPLSVKVYKPVVPATYISNFTGQIESVNSLLSYKYLDGVVNNVSPNCKIELISSKPDVVQVNSEALNFTTIKYGSSKVKIRFITELGNDKKSVVTKSVKIYVKEPKLSVKPEIRLKKNKSKLVKLTNVPKTATVSWNSTNAAAVSVKEQGRKAVITANNINDAATITASYSGQQYSFVVNTYGKVNADGAPSGGSDQTTKKMEVHFLDVGQGDCTIITSDGHAMMIDGGPEDKGTAIQLYLKNLGITKLDYVILTHYDTDHIGGADVIIQKFNCDKIIMPAYTQNNVAYRNLMQVMGSKGYKSIVPKAGDEYVLGDAKITILSPLVAYTSNYNNNSICLKVQSGEDSFLFTGDADSTIEGKLKDSSYDISAKVYKVAHHGSRYSTSKEFLKKVNPEYAIVSCGAGNSYGHPHAEVMNTLRSLNIKLFRTDDQGVIIASSNGKGITWNASPTENWKAGEQTESDQDEPSKGDDVNPDPVDPTPGNITYVLNMNTKKFHLLSCSSVVTIAPKNRQDVDWTRDKCIAEGYEPCKNCKP